MNTVLHIDSEKSWRGGQQQVLYLVEGLKSYDNIVACPPQSPLEERAKASGLRVLPVRMRGEWDFLAISQLRKIIRRNRIRIVHLHSPHAHALGLLGAKLAGSCRVVISRRVDFHIGNNILSRMKYLRADKIIAISQRVKQVLMADGVPGDKIAVVYSGVDIGKFQNVEGDYLFSELGIDRDKPIIGNIAALAWHKDHKTLIEAARIVVDRFPGVIFLIVGDGPLYREIEVLIRSLHLEEQVKLLGFRRDVPEILSILSLFVLSSSWEGLGTSLLDAFASRIPVVATNVGGIPEVVENGRNGILVPPGNPHALAEAIMRLLQDRVLAGRLGKEGFRLVRGKFNVQKMVGQTRKIYEELLM